MSEIGSEFWDVPIVEKRNGLFPESTQWFLSGRVALQAIIQEIGTLKTVSIPSWCCDSIIKPFIDAGIKVRFYPVYWENGLIQDINMDSDALFIMDYFGYTSAALDLSNYNGIVIRDVTHSILSAKYSDSDYYFGSLRKWCGVWTGGFAWARDGHKLATGGKDTRGYVSLRKKAMHEKENYITGISADKDYLRVFGEAEDLLESTGIQSAANRDVGLARQLDVEGIANRRKANAEILHVAFRDWLIFPEKRDTDCPMFVPVLVPSGKRDELREHLIQREIYCPVHWPLSQYHRINDEQALYIYKNELSLVCDQRYTEDDMNRMVEAINAL